MPKYRNDLPQLKNDRFLTDGGLETTLVFHDGLELPEFAAFTLLSDEKGRRRLRDYFDTYLAIAKEHQTSFVLESVTWRANPDWAAKLGYSMDKLAEFNRAAIAMLVDIRNAYETDTVRMPISGCVGPRGDGYVPSAAMNADEAQAYHSVQINTFAETEADLVSAITMNYTAEAIGITRAAQAANIPVVISFTVETDGCLPTGQSLKDAIEEVDAATNNGPAYYMINCAHPTHFQSVLKDGGPWAERIRGLRANSSKRSHAELDEADELDKGNPVELGTEYKELMTLLPNVTVLGGCCGTDHRHVGEIAKSCVAA